MMRDPFGEDFPRTAKYLTIFRGGSKTWRLGSARPNLRASKRSPWSTFRPEKMPAIENVDTSYCHFVGDAHIILVAKRPRRDAGHHGDKVSAATPQRASRKPTAPSAGFSTDFESYV